MNKLFALAILALAVTLPTQAQTTCSTTSPCAAITVTNSSVVTTTNLYICQGAATQCDTTALNSFIAAPTTPSVWRVVSFPQTTASRVYNDPEPAGALMNYAASNSNAGGTGPVSGILVFQLPPAPSPVPTAPSLQVKQVTTGNVGPQ